MTKVSIVVPVYNVEKYVSRCLDSILEQTLTDIEVVCVNDGSSDNSLEIIQNYKKKDNRIKIVSQQNQGLSVARNTGLDNCCGDFIAFIDSDDWIEGKDYLEKLYNAAIENDADISVSQIVRCVDKKNGKEKRSFVLKFDKEETTNDYKRKLQLCDVPDYCYVWNKLYKRDSLLKTGIKFVPGVLYEDVYFTPKILYYTGKMVVVPDVNYIYFRHSGTILANHTDKAMAYFYDAEEKMLEFFKQAGVDASQWRTVVKKHKFLGLTYYKTATKGKKIKHTIFNLIKWETKL